MVQSGTSRNNRSSSSGAPVLLFWTPHLRIGSPENRQIPAFFDLDDLEILWERTSRSHEHKLPLSQHLRVVDLRDVLLHFAISEVFQIFRTVHCECYLFLLYAFVACVITNHVQALHNPQIRLLGIVPVLRFCCQHRRLQEINSPVFITQGEVSL